MNEQFKEKRLDDIKEFVLLQNQKLSHDKDKMRVEELIERRVEELKGVMHEAVERVAESVRMRALRVLDPTAELEEEINELDLEISMLENGQDIMHTMAPAKGREYYDDAIARLEQKVRSIRERPELNIDPKEMIPFNKRNIMDALLKTVSILGEPSSNMITYDRVIDLERPSQPIEIAPQIPVPWGAGTFQTRSKLFVCGGLGRVEGKEKFLNSFYSSDEKGKCEHHALMKKERAALSICGGANMIFALGGMDNENDLQDVEQYLFDRNNWNSLPELNEARSWAASCIDHRTQTLYCFCGCVQTETYMNTVESLDLGSQSQWKLYIAKRIPPIYHCGAVCLPGQKFLLFGGTDQVGYFTLKLRRDFTVEQQDYNTEEAPGWIGWGTVLSQWGKVYVYGSRHNWDFWQVKVFDGYKWADLAEKPEIPKRIKI